MHFLINPRLLPKILRKCLKKWIRTRTCFPAFPENGDNRDVIEDTLGCLLGRLSLLDSVVNQRCHQMKERLQQILNFQVRHYQEALHHLPATFNNKQDLTEV